MKESGLSEKSSFWVAGHITGIFEIIDQAKEANRIRNSVESSKAREGGGLRNATETGAEKKRLLDKTTKLSPKNQKKKDLIDKATELLGGPGT